MMPDDLSREGFWEDWCYATPDLSKVGGFLFVVSAEKNPGGAPPDDALLFCDAPKE